MVTALLIGRKGRVGFPGKLIGISQFVKRGKRIGYYGN